MLKKTQKTKNTSTHIPGADRKTMHIPTFSKEPRVKCNLRTLGAQTLGVAHKWVRGSTEEASGSREGREIPSVTSSKFLVDP